ncbi:MAG: hypothetical protein BGO99_10155 [Nitrosospira sp. 56-18]|nr:MAG: hypothetical protein BGO99_10155 [Nitrosospira sp. 56-18]
MPLLRVGKQCRSGGFPARNGWFLPWRTAGAGQSLRKPVPLLGCQAGAALREATATHEWFPASRHDYGREMRLA